MMTMRDALNELRKAQHEWGMYFDSAFSIEVGNMWNRYCGSGRQDWTPFVEWFRKKVEVIVYGDSNKVY